MPSMSLDLKFQHMVGVFIVFVVFVRYDVYMYAHICVYNYMSMCAICNCSMRMYTYFYLTCTNLI